jgi:3',5'-cyclic AMP phosphodiesterase CpdA
MAPFEALLDKMMSEKPDKIVITGDLVNLALPQEYAQVESVLQKHGLSAQNTVVIPGNHDRYTPAADLLAAFETGMRRWLPEGFRRNGYPLVTHLGNVTIVGLNTGVWRGPLRAAGRLGDRQISLARKVLNSRGVKNTHTIIAMHHPPFAVEGTGLKQLRDGLQDHREFVDAMGGTRALVIHGHSHKWGRRKIGTLDVIGVTSASNDIGTAEKQMAYNTYEFNADGLVRATMTRLWPAAHNTEQDRFERVPL